MLYPNTQPSGVAGGNGQDNKRRLQELLARSGAAPLFGGSGRSASVASLPNAAAPGLSYNPFLQMLNNHPGETLNNLPSNNPQDGYVGSSVPTGPGVGSPGTQSTGGQMSAGGPNPFDNGGNAAAGSLGHFNDTLAGGAYDPTQGVQATSPSGTGLSPTNPFFHLLLQQLQNYGYDS